MHRIKLLITTFVSIIVAFVMVACGTQEVTTEPTPDEPIETELLLSFIPDVQFAPIYVGLEQGFFSEAGFDVTITHQSESDIARQVSLGGDAFRVGVISGQQQLLAQAQGLDTLFVYEWYQRYPIALAAKAETGLSSPADLEGLSVGVPLAEGESYLGLLALLEEAGLTENDIDLQVTGFTQVETLATDQVDVVVVYTVNEPVQLAERGIPVDVIEVADVVDLVSNGIIVNAGQTESSPERVEAFLAAFERSLEYATANPDEAFEASTNYVEGLDDPDVAPIARQVLAEAIELWQADDLGFSEEASWEAMQQSLIAAGLLDEPVNLDAVYTNQYLPE